MTALPKGFKYDKKSGRKVKIDLRKSKTAKLAARKRKGKKLNSAVRLKIAKALRRVHKTGRTGSGRKSKAA